MQTRTRYILSETIINSKSKQKYFDCCDLVEATKQRHEKATDEKQKEKVISHQEKTDSLVESTNGKGYTRDAYCKE